MRILYVLQRYGHEVSGGAERHCREFATRMAARGHDVEVLTSCAISHVDWANAYPPGTADLDGVTVHRIPVGRPKVDREVAPLNGRVEFGWRTPPLHVQHRWLELQGPDLPGLVPWLVENAAAYDVAVFFTYLFTTAWDGLASARTRVPVVLHPTAHDEPALCIPFFDTVFRHPHAFAFSSEEERDLVISRFGTRQRSEVIGVGVDLPETPAAPAEIAGFRARYGLGERPYLVYVGRVEPAKGSTALHAYFSAYKERRPGPLALVLVGSVVSPVPGHPDVVTTGFVDDATRRAALAGATALVQPSFFESFSMVLTESWSAGRAVLVQGHCAVLAGQCRRSGGGLPYRDFAEFEAAVDRLTTDPALARAMGAAGRRYVEARYQWGDVMARYERFLNRVVTDHRGRLAALPCGTHDICG